MSSLGYKWIKAPDGHGGVNTKGYIYEHIIVAEKMLGRPLNEGETVHHIDYNKQNNDPSNLMVFASSADHTAFHKGAHAYKDGDVYKTERQNGYKCVCQMCGCDFFVQNKHEVNDRKYCSAECAHNSFVKTYCDLEYIQGLIREHNGNFSEVARMLGVSSSGLHKRLRVNGLPSKSREYQ